MLKRKKKKRNKKRKMKKRSNKKERKKRKRNKKKKRKKSCPFRNISLALGEIFHSLPQSPRINAGVALRLDKVYLLPHPVQIVIHRSLIRLAKSSTTPNTRV